MPDPKTVDDLLRSGLIKKGNDESLNLKRLSIGISVLDGLLGGGVPIGRCMEAYGEESTGKTLIAQYIAATVQKTEHNKILYMDVERSFDEDWWKKSGVDTDELMVSSPVTAEATLDVMRSVLHSEPNLGLIILDSIAAMSPRPLMDPEKSSEDRTIGLLAQVVTLMYHQIVPLLEDRVIFYATNQMRESIGAYSELASLPGGRAQRHFSHIILKTRRDSWIQDTNKNRTGYYMEITSRKNKVSGVPDGTFVVLPVLFDGQIDMLTAYIEDALTKKVIVRAGPYYKWDGRTLMGRDNLRTFFVENPEKIQELQLATEAATP